MCVLAVWVVTDFRPPCSIHWDSAKRFWAQHPITNPKSFAVLLSVWPPALQELMKALTPREHVDTSQSADAAEADAQVQVKLHRNVRMLLNVGNTDLAKQCLGLAPDGRSLSQVGHVKSRGLLCLG